LASLDLAVHNPLWPKERSQAQLHFETFNLNNFARPRDRNYSTPSDGAW